MKYADRIQSSTTTTGTSNLTIAGAIDTFKNLASANIFGSGLIPVTIVHQDRSLNEFETSLCSLSGTDLTRVKVISSSNSNDFVNFSAGTKYVFIDYIAQVHFPGTQLFKEAVKVVFTSNTTLSTVYAGVAQDGYTLQAGDRFLVTGQSDERENGIYVAQAATSAPVRANDAYTGDVLGNAIIPVYWKNSSTLNATMYFCNRGVAVIGTDNLTFLPFINSTITSSTDNTIPRYDGTIGSRLQSSNLVISDDDKLKYFSSYSQLATQSGSGTITLNLNTDNKHLITLTNNATLALSNVSVGQCFAVRVKQDSTGGRTLTWFSGINWPSDSVPTVTPTANKYDWFGFICTALGEYGTGEFDGFLLGQNYG